MNWRELKQAVLDEERRLGIPLDDYEVRDSEWGETFDAVVVSMFRDDVNSLRKNTPHITFKV